MFGFSFFLGLFLLLVALVMCFVPVEETAFTDPCGSIFFPDKVFQTIDANGLREFKVTPPCSEAHNERLIWVIVASGLGVLLLVFSLIRRKA